MIYDAVERYTDGTIRADKDGATVYLDKTGSRVDHDSYDEAAQIKPSPKMPVPKSTAQTELLIPQSEMKTDDNNLSHSIEITIITDGKPNKAMIKTFPCVLGRSSLEANIILEDPSISRKHAVIDLVGGRFIIIDNNASNGTIVNGVKLNPGSMQAISTGDVVKLGRTEVQIMAVSNTGG